MTSSFIVPQKSPYKSGKQRDPDFFEKLHREKLGRVTYRCKEDSISNILKEEKELTFHPNIGNPLNLKRRSVQEFLEDQVRVNINLYPSNLTSTC